MLGDAVCAASVRVEQVILKKNHLLANLTHVELRAENLIKRSILAHSIGARALGLGTILGDRAGGLGLGSLREHLAISGLDIVLEALLGGGSNLRALESKSNPLDGDVLILEGELSGGDILKSVIPVVDGVVAGGTSSVEKEVVSLILLSHYVVLNRG